MTTTPQGRGLGLVPAPADPRSYAYPFVAAAQPPPDLDLRARMQPVGDQGRLGSCTGWAGTASVESWRRNGQRSPLYVYYRDRQADGAPAPSQDTGATMLGLCKALQQWGVCAESVWPYDVRYYNEPPSAIADGEAALARVDTYYQIKAQGLALLQGVWAALQAEHTVLLALLVYPEFEQTGPDGKAPMPRPGSPVLGGHAVCACGWFNDQSAPGGYGWVMVQNSWGQGFGDQGYVYLPAAYFTSGIVQEAWVITYAAPPEPPPAPEVDVDIAAIDARLDDIRAQVQFVQTVRPTSKMTKADILAGIEEIWTHELGPIDDMAREAQELLHADPKEPDGPVDPPPPEPPQFVAPIADGAVYGQTKWLPGSTGCDLFCRRGTPVVAPADGTVRYVAGGTGQSGGAECILATDGNTHAWRYRHVQAQVRVGQRVRQGEQVAVVNDPSLDLLGAVPAWAQPVPDQYQHLDLSYNGGTDQFSSQGGGGGNRSAYGFLVMIGYRGRVLARTPGPPDAGR